MAAEFTNHSPGKVLEVGVGTGLASLTTDMNTRSTASTFHRRCWFGRTSGCIASASATSRS
jgi:hypothetical protein